MARGKKYILAIDQGTTGSRAFIFDARGKVVAGAYKELRQYYPKPGWVEHDADEIWDSVCAVIRQAAHKAGINPASIAGIGITNQRETTVVWDRATGKPVHRAIVWQCRRTADICRQPRLQKKTALIRKTTGLVLDAYFSATKLRWLLDNVRGLKPKAASGKLAFGTIDSWLIYKLTGGAVHRTDPTNASRTMLFDIRRKAWSPAMLDLFGVPLAMMPEVVPSGSVFGHSAGVAGIPQGVPITAVMGDQQAALYGQGCFTSGTSKNTYGTGCFLLVNTGKKCVYSQNGLLTTLGCDGTGAPVYVLEGAVFIAGAVVQWLRDELKVVRDSASTETMIKGLKDTHGVYVVPAFVGLGAPYWHPQARGIITGLTRGAHVRHLVRAALESMAYQTKDIFDLMQREAGLKIKSLAVDGGACRNDFLMQFQAGLLRAEILRLKMIDSTVAGAAYLAGVTAGLWTPQKVRAMKSLDRKFKPRMSVAQARELYAGWQKAVRQAMAG